MKIGVDVISGESAIEELILGCVDAVNETGDIEVVMIGKGEVYKPILNQKKVGGKCKDLKRISILEASQVISMEDDPLTIVKQKKDSSIVKGLYAHKNNEIDAFFSPGNTGAIVVASALVLGRLKGLKKPALASLIPTVNGTPNVLLDVGASAECEVEDFLNFAVMGRIYSHEMLGIDNPRVGLLNIGEEEHKGTTAVKAAYKKLSDMDINFIGNVEGRDIFDKKADVIVCDGHIGNIALKTAEGAGSALGKMLKQAIKKNPLAVMSYIFYGGAVKELRSRMDPEKFGGVPLLGVNGNVFIGHGNSGREAIKYGILNAAIAVRNDILGKINRQVQELRSAEA